MSEAEQEEAAISSHREQLTMLHREIDFQRQSFATRYAAMGSRAVVLIGSASVTSALHIGDKPAAPEIVAVGAAMLAALLGILTLIPKSGKEVDLAPVRDDLFTFSPGKTEMNLLNTKISNLEADEKSLTRWGMVQIAGYLLLAVAITLALYQSTQPVTK